MAENEGLDLSKVINLIMENPKLIEEISSLAKGNKTAEDSPADLKSNEAKETQVAEVPTPAVTYTEPKPKKSRRGELLGAMKPYLSDERAKALDSVLTIAEILNLMKER